MNSSRNFRFGWPIAIGAYSAGAALSGSVAALSILSAPLIAIPAGLWLISGTGRWITAFLAASILLPPLPIAAGNSGPHPSIIFAAAGAGIGLLRLREWSFAIGGVGQWLLLFLSVLISSLAPAAWYSGFEVAAASLVRVMLFGISVYVYFYLVNGPGRHSRFCEPRSARWLFASATIAAVFACADFYFQFPAPAGYGPQFVWLDTGVYRRAQGMFYEASTLGNFCVFFLVGIAASLRTRIASRPVLLLAASLLSAALIFSYSRASIVNLVIALATLLYLQRQRFQLRRVLGGLTLAAGAGAAAAFYLLPDFARTYGTRIMLTWQNFFSETNLVLSHRPENWRDLFAFLSDQPWAVLLGVGYKTLPYSSVAGRPLIVDNMYLTLLVETGIAGLLVFLGLSYAILQTSYRAARSSGESASFFGTWMFCFWIGELAQMLTGDLLTYWRVLPVYFWVLGSATAALRRDDENSIRRSVR